MSTQKINPRFAILIGIMLLVAIIRYLNSAQIIPLSNFTPVGAMALFGGSYFSNKWKAFVFPLLTLLLSDIAINLLIYKGKYGVMYHGWYWVYGIFILITFYGKTIIKNATIKNVLIAGIVAAFSHWLISDFIVWISGGTDIRTMTPLARNFAGLCQSYIQGIPFMKNFLAGTIVYSGVMFGSFEWIQKQYPTLQLSPASNKK